MRWSKSFRIDSPLCFDKRLYTLELSVKERQKQKCYTNIKTREKVRNLNSIRINE